MSEDQRLVLSRNIHLFWTTEGALRLGGSISRDDLDVSPATVNLLHLFAQPQSVAAVLSEWSGGPEKSGSVAAAIAGLREAGALVPADGEAELAPGWNAQPHVHLEMLEDVVRTLSFARAIERQAPGKVVADVGCGSGILSLFAARAGARRVYAVEESAAIELAREIVRANGFEEVVQFVPGNSRDVELPERVDLVVSELIASFDPLAERILPVLADARDRFLSGDGSLIPSRLDVCAVGVDSGRGSSERRQRSAAVAPLTELYGFDLSPLGAALEDSADGGGAYHVDLSQASDEKVLTDEAVVASYRLGDPAPTVEQRSEIRLPVAVGGNLDALGLYFKAWLDERTLLTTSPFTPRQATSWGGQALHPVEPSAVREGEMASFEVAWLPQRRGYGSEPAYRIAPSAR
ncbi:MAG TPA: 50S ribosomal protein L11 methyltransferase [Solirubrobacterales bacterium]|nr:50S ribosomal protein L11 methyltransferase [Solirubrobacterales bacterium]